MKKHAIPLIRIFLLILIGLVIGTSVYSVNAKMTGDMLPMPFGVGASVILSGSMEPELSVDDMVVVARRESYDVGDIVAYQSGKSVVMHRIIDITDDGLIVAKGDANNVADTPFTAEKIKGELAFAIPKAGVVLYALQNGAVRIAIACAAFFLFERSWAKDRKKKEAEQKRIREELDQLRREFGKTEAE